MRSRISSSLTTRFLRPSRCRVSSISFSTSGSGSGEREPAFILVVALAGLLAEAAGFAQRVGDLRLDAAVLARAPADIEAGEIAHRERAHRHAEFGHHGVDLLRQRAFEQQLLGLLAALGQHAVADEAVADADHRRHLGDLARDRDRRGQRIRRGLRRAHDLAQLHDVGRREEVHAEHVLRTLGLLRDLVDVEIGGVGGEHRARLGKLVERAEHFLLDRHGLEHGFDHQVSVLDVLEADHAVDQRHALGGRIGRDAAARGGRFLVLLHHAHAALELLFAGLDQRDGDAGIGKRHRDAAAHGAGADDGDAVDLARLGAFGHAGDLGGLALGEEGIALRLGLVAG